MNLLGIQDVLKNASDQQLMQLMRSPDSTAPSYLVLSELSRRKEMRSKQAQPPQGTVAQDLTKDDSTYADQQGIRSLRMPGYEDEAQAAETNPDEGIEALREGGIVRMSGGGSSPRPIGELPREDVLEYLQSLRFGPGPGGIRSPYSESDLRTRLDEITMGQRAPMIAQSAGDPNNTVPIPGLNYEAGAFIAPGQPPASFTPPPTTTPPVTTPPVTTPPVTTPPVTPPVAPPGRPSSGVRALTPNAAPTAAEPNGLPTLAQNMERNLGMFPGIPQELLDRIKSSRTNEGERRREAQNMGLIEAGLRMAASNNPRLGAAFAEGAAPAVQSYSQQLSQIRQDQNADLTRDLAVAQQDLQRRYMAGQISASELQRQTQMLLSNNEIAARMRVAQMQAASAAASAGRNPQLELLQAVQRNPELAQAHARMNGRGPEALAAANEGRAEQRLAARVTALTGQINVNRQLLSDPNLTDPQRAEINEELRQLAVESRSLRAQMSGGLGGSLSPPVPGQARDYNLPGR